MSVLLTNLPPGLEDLGEVHRDLITPSSSHSLENAHSFIPCVHMKDDTGDKIVKNNVLKIKNLCSPRENALTF